MGRAAAREELRTHGTALVWDRSGSPAGRRIATAMCAPPVRQRGGRGAGVPLGFTAPAAPAAVRVRDNYRRVSRSSDLFSFLWYSANHGLLGPALARRARSRVALLMRCLLDHLHPRLVPLRVPVPSPLPRAAARTKIPHYRPGALRDRCVMRPQPGCAHSRRGGTWCSRRFAQTVPAAGDR